MPCPAHSACLRCHAARSALECRSCSRPAFKLSMIRARAPRRRRGWARCAPNSSNAGSTDLSCRAPTASRTNICRRAKNAWPGSPASPVRPVPPSCWPSAPCCSSTAATPCRRKRRSIASFSPSSIWSTHPPDQWLENNLKSGAKLGYDPWLHTTEGAEKLRKACATAGAELVAVDGNPIDAIVDRPPGAARRQGHAARPQTRRRKRRRQAQARASRTEKAARRCAGGVGSAERRLGLQYPRRRCGAYAAGARLRAHSARGTSLRSISTAASSTTKRATRWKRSLRCARRTSSRATSVN